jgi:hypothetical protein
MVLIAFAGSSKPSALPAGFLLERELSVLTFHSHVPDRVSIVP